MNNIFQELEIAGFKLGEDNHGEEVVGVKDLDYDQRHGYWFVIVLLKEKGGHQSTSSVGFHKEHQIHAVNSLEKKMAKLHVDIVDAMKHCDFMKHEKLASELKEKSSRYAKLKTEYKNSPNFVNVVSGDDIMRVELTQEMADMMVVSKKASVFIASKREFDRLTKS